MTLSFPTVREALSAAPPAGLRIFSAYHSAPSSVQSGQSRPAELRHHCGVETSHGGAARRKERGIIGGKKRHSTRVTATVASPRYSHRVSDIVTSFIRGECVGVYYLVVG